MKINLDFLEEKYRNELELMKKQYGQEEDLYPWIYMLLLASGNTEKLSVRHVAGAPWAQSVLGRELLKGYVGFPDIVILDKEFHAINLDEIEDNEKILSIVRKWIVSGDVPEEIFASVIELYNKIISQKPRKGEGGWEEDIRKVWYRYNLDKIRGCVEVKKIGDKLIDISKGYYKINISMCEENYKKSSISLCKDNGEQKGPWLLESGDKISNAGQIFGELFWYGKVLYTNGKQWKYLKVKKCSNDKDIKNIVDLRNELYRECVKVQKPKPESKWYKKISNLQEINGLQIIIQCNTFPVDETKCEIEDNRLADWLKNTIDFTEMYIDITVEDYFKELQLMEKQYGLEEELYPWIYMLLQMTKHENVSIRDVHKAQKCSFKSVESDSEYWITRWELTKRVGPPDMAIFDEESNKILGCVEIKERSKLGDLKQGKISIGKLFPTKWEIRYKYLIKENVEPQKKEVEGKIKNCLKYYNLENVKVNKDKNVYTFIAKVGTQPEDEIGPKNVDSSVWKATQVIPCEFMSKDNNRIGIFNDKNEVVQLIGHVEKFKKVLYTNGLKFYYLKLEKEEEDKDVINIREIADLTSLYENYKNFPTCLDVLSKANDEWNKLRKELRNINWGEESTSEVLTEK